MMQSIILQSKTEVDRTRYNVKFVIVCYLTVSPRMMQSIILQSKTEVDRTRYNVK